MVRAEEDVLAAAAAAVPTGEALVEELLGETPCAVEGVAAEGTEAVVLDADVAEEAVEGPVPKPKRRKKVHVSDDVKNWFLDYCDIQWSRFQWPTTKCLKEAQALAPELFGGIHADTPRKWSRTPCKASSGRHQLLPDAHMTVLSEYVTHVCEQLPVNSPVLTVVFNEHLKNMGLKITVSERWTRRFVKQLGYNFRKCCRQSAVDIPQASATDMQQNLAQKIRYIQWTENIPDNRVWNLDETSCKLLPVGDTGYRMKNRPSNSVGDSRLQ
eukprot:5503771-Amphidinium_carterae.1